MNVTLPVNNFSQSIKAENWSQISLLSPIAVWAMLHYGSIWEIMHVYLFVLYHSLLPSTTTLVLIFFFNDLWSFPNCWSGSAAPNTHYSTSWYWFTVIEVIHDSYCNWARLKNQICHSPVNMETLGSLSYYTQGWFSPHFYPNKHAYPYLHMWLDHSNCILY